MFLAVYKRWNGVQLKKPIKCLKPQCFCQLQALWLPSKTHDLPNCITDICHWFFFFFFLGLPGSDQDREDLQSRLRLAEIQAEELAESLRAATSSMEQYRAMAQSLEESLDKEKQVQNQAACVLPSTNHLKYLCENT